MERTWKAWGGSSTWCTHRERWGNEFILNCKYTHACQSTHINAIRSLYTVDFILLCIKNEWHSTWKHVSGLWKADIWGIRFFLYNSSRVWTGCFVFAAVIASSSLLTSFWRPAVVQPTTSFPSVSLSLSGGELQPVQDELGVVEESFNT